ncbi:OmpA family protein, partial [Tenacibaculum maritimum]
VQEVDLGLVPLIVEDQIVIKPIYFDFDKWDIREDAEYELEHIVSVMNNHPNMVIRIESHTDSRGSKGYNRRLSDKRAKSTRDYLISRGIEGSRIASAIGYGEDQ